MKIFVIGASGYIGSHAARALVAAGHEVVGLARSEAAAAKVRELGATPSMGDVSDPARLARAALDADATVFAPQLHQDEEHATVKALLEALAGSGKAFVFTSGTGVISQRTDGDWSEDSFAEDDAFVPCKYTLTRRGTELAVRAAGDAGLRAMVIRPPLMWGNGYHGFIEAMTRSVRLTGAACYIGSGLNLYTNVHVEDLARLFVAVVERGRAGALYHAVGGEVNNRTLAEWVAERHGVATRSITPSEAVELWGKFMMLVVLGACSRSRAPRSRQELGWAPRHLDVLGELRSGALQVHEHQPLAASALWNRPTALAS